MVSFVILDPNNGNNGFEILVAAMKGSCIKGDVFMAMSESFSIIQCKNLDKNSDHGLGHLANYEPLFPKRKSDQKNTLPGRDSRLINIQWLIDYAISAGYELREIGVKVYDGSGASLGFTDKVLTEEEIPIGVIYSDLDGAIYFPTNVLFDNSLGDISDQFKGNEICEVLDGSCMGEELLITEANSYNPGTGIVTYLSFKSGFQPSCSDYTKLLVKKGTSKQYNVSAHDGAFYFRFEVAIPYSTELVQQISGAKYAVINGGTNDGKVCSVGALYPRPDPNVTRINLQDPVGFSVWTNDYTSVTIWGWNQD